MMDNELRFQLRAIRPTIEKAMQLAAKRRDTVALFYLAGLSASLVATLDQAIWHAKTRRTAQDILDIWIERRHVGAAID
jgi:hypothetical protein